MERKMNEYTITRYVSQISASFPSSFSLKLWNRKITISQLKGSYRIGCKRTHFSKLLSSKILFRFVCISTLICMQRRLNHLFILNVFKNPAVAHPLPFFPHPHFKNHNSQSFMKVHIIKAYWIQLSVNVQMTDVDSHKYKTYISLINLTQTSTKWNKR